MVRAGLRVNCKLQNVLQRKPVARRVRIFVFAVSREWGTSRGERRESLQGQRAACCLVSWALAITAWTRTRV